MQELPTLAIDQAAAVLQAGGLVGMPTETVYGLAADATDAEAVLGIYRAKQRPSFDPLIVHVADPAQAETVAVVDESAAACMAAFWPGPLTLILPRRACIPDVVTAGLDSVGVRCPAHEQARALIRRSGRPLAAPSANRFGRLSPTTAAAVHEQLGETIAGIVDGGPCEVGVESTVLRLRPEPLILRPGGVTAEALAAFFGRPIPVASEPAVAAGLAQEAPGLLASHYAPTTPVRLKQPAEPWPVAPHFARLAFTGADLPAEGGPTEILSAQGDDGVAAQALFAALRRLDACGCEVIMAELLPEEGLGLAVNDRLRRAAHAR